MKRKPPSEISTEPPIVPAWHDPKLIHDPTEEAETEIWLLNQLLRIRALVEEHGADEEMIEAIDYALEDCDSVFDLDLPHFLQALSKQAKPSSA